MLLLHHIRFDGKNNDKMCVCLYLSVWCMWQFVCFHLKLPPDDSFIMNHCDVQLPYLKQTF